MVVPFTLGFSFLVLFSFLFGGSLQCGGSHKRGGWGETRLRRRSHSTTHRSNTVCDPHFRISHVLINDGHALLVNHRCEDVANPLPRNGGCLSGHIHPIHCARRHFRPLTSRLFILPIAPPPVIDNLEFNHPLIAPSSTSLSWISFPLTLLETQVIHSPVFITYYELHITDNSGTVSNSVVDSHLVSLHFHSHSPARVPPLEATHYQTQYPPLVPSDYPLAPF